MDAVQAANSGHPGMPMGAAPMAHALWSRHLRFSPKNPKWANRDRFILSAGHGSMLLYGLLHLAGFGLPLDELKRFRQLHSLTPGHPENTMTPGVEMATGPLGQGLSTAVGLAIAERFLAATFNKPGYDLFDHFTYVICSDGDLMEGITNEAGSLAGHQRLGKLIALYDDNQITIDGATSLGFTENVGARYEALGWDVQRVDGMDVEAVSAAIEKAKASDKPSLICCSTIIGFGSPNKAGSQKSHGAPLGVDEVAATKAQLGIPAEPAFWKAPEAETLYAQLAEQGSAAEAAWDDLYARYRQDYPTEAAALEQAWSGATPTNLWSSLPQFDDKVQTRQASHKTLNAIASLIPTFVGGSADLAESNLTHIAETSNMQSDAPAGRNIPFGVREHAMAAAANGINLHGGMRAFCATFLIFSDYCRPSIRLAALMKCPTIFAFTHDSIGVGEDGPTHQPIEHLPSLRAMPNLNVMRPADGNETAVCWAMAVERQDGPSLLALTRQPVPALTPAANGDHPARRGGYVLQEASGTAQVVLVATGSEVGVAADARAILEEAGIPTRVVSMPSTYLFDRQERAYRESVLPGRAFKVSIEAAATFGWHKYVDFAIGLDRFGESAPLGQLMDEFGFTGPKVAEKVLAQVRAVQPI